MLRGCRGSRAAQASGRDWTQDELKQAEIWHLLRKGIPLEAQHMMTAATHYGRILAGGLGRGSECLSKAMPNSRLERKIDTHVVAIRVPYDKRVQVMNVTWMSKVVRAI